MARKTISRQSYNMRRGDLVKFAGNRPRSAPAWSPTAEGLRSQEDWIQVAEAEEMTLVGRIPTAAPMSGCWRGGLPPIGVAGSWHGTTSWRLWRQRSR